MKQESGALRNANRAKLYQLVLFPMNNGATNVYYILTMNFIAYYANGVLGLLLMFATTMVTVMRLFDAVTDPIIGALIDRTSTKFGKFRPYMVLGNGIMILSSLLLYFGTRVISPDMAWLRYTCFVLFYALYVIGYTFQTACTRSGQTCLTNDPNQRPLFTVFNTVASLIGMGLVQFLAPVLSEKLGGYNSASFFNFMIPLAIGVSAVLTLLAVIGIWEKDRPEFFGVGGTQEKVQLSEYIAILKANKELQRLMVAGAGCKLAFSIATNMTVLCMLYGAMMGNYGGLYLPMMIVGYVFSAPFFLLTVRTSQKLGQKASLVRYTTIALAMYVGVLVLLLLWRPGAEVFRLSLMPLNIYTVLFVLFFGIGYGAYYATADMPIPMVADCSDYETYRSGRYIPGIMGTLFSLVDKLVSSLGSTIVGIAVAMIGISTLPDGNTPYADGMHTVVLVLFCVIPMLAWIATLIAMKGYTLTGARMKEIQAVNAVRKDAIGKGMKLSEAMEKWKTLEQVPEEYRQ
ncbi:MAG: sugar transporter [Lachnospiraceae bacterium]|nr:sugar transporter [Lachnospiraceae bacterium]